MNVWAKFFCSSCQRERPISERRRTGKNRLSRCVGCVQKTRFLDAAKRESGDFEPYESQPIPDAVMDAYREAQE